MRIFPGMPRTELKSLSRVVYNILFPCQSKDRRRKDFLLGPYLAPVGARQVLKGGKLSIQRDIKYVRLAPLGEWYVYTEGTPTHTTDFN